MLKGDELKLAASFPCSSRRLIARKREQGECRGLLMNERRWRHEDELKFNDELDCLAVRILNAALKRKQVVFQSKKA